MADGFLSTLCAGDEVGVVCMGTLRVAEMRIATVTKITSSTITVDDGSVFSRNSGVLRGEAKFRRITNFLRPATEVKVDIARQEERDKFTRVKKAASGILADMSIGTDKECLKKQCEEIRKILIEMEEVSAAYSRLK